MNHLDDLFDRWLKASYRYYKEFDQPPLMTDEEYDQISRRLLGRHSSLEHPFASLACEDDFRCGSGFAIQWTPESIEYVRAK